MRYSVKGILNAAKNYTVFDYGCLKIALLSAGMLLGIYYAPFLINYTKLLLIVFIGSFIWIVYRTFFKHMR